ncbi:GNAT family N-acetyltransferase [Emcibacter sp. SYSU 3D8]|uniref:GNAT family N-acetyltransferase n=1 Tax=Emcibacter sp. SYSU 3D8 TaxID=3133969 RepID=UPI0031FEAF80
MIRVEKAKRHHLADIVAMLANDPIGSTREDASEPLNPAYIAAFNAISADQNQFLAVALLDQSVVGTLHLSFIPGLALTGAWRGQIESVRIRQDHRDAGLGGTMIEWAIGRCREKGCRIVQLTTDKSRRDAHRFYERLGFEATHEGYKLKL